MKVFNRNIGKNETYATAYTFKNPDGSLMDLTGHTVRLIVTNKANAALVTSNATIANGVATFNYDNALAVGRYRYRVEHQWPNNDIFWIVKGDWVVAND